MPNQEVTNGQLLEAIQSVDRRLDITRDDLFEAIQTTNKAVKSVDQRLDATRNELSVAIQATSEAVQSVNHRLDTTRDELFGAIKSVSSGLTSANHRIDDVLTAINEFASQTEERFQRIEGLLPTLATKEDLKNFATKNDLAKLEVRMVSKIYLDAKLADHHSELVKLFRKEIAEAKA